MKTFIALLASILLFASRPAFAQDEGHAFGIEYTSTFWMLGGDGAIRAGGRTVDLQSDLGITGRRVNDLMRVTLKLGQTHRIVLEGASFELQGWRDVTVPFTFSGGNFSFQDAVYAKPRIRYAFVGYARNLINTTSDQLGIEVGASYLRGTGFVQSLHTGLTATRSKSLPLPIVGLDYTHSLSGIAERFEISGDASGMSAGNYGHYARGSAKVGARIWSHLFVSGGYGILSLNASKHGDSVDVRFRGPLVSVEFRDR
jgi:hypothetical protein